MVNSPEYDRCKQAPETASHILYDCEALATLRFKHLHCHFKNPGDFEDFSVHKTLHLVQGAGLLNEGAQGLHRRSIMVEVYGSLGACPSVFFSILL